MARSHHRKKHKGHLQSFRQSHTAAAGEATSAKSNGKWVFGIAGLLSVGAILFFATSGDMLWTLVGAAAGCVAGYLIGKKVDEGKG